MPDPDLRDALRAALTRALKAHDRVAVGALRSALGAIDNAEAVDPSAAPAAQTGRIAGGVAGLGAGEVARVTLSGAAVRAVVEGEIAERSDAAGGYERLGRADDAARLRAEIAVLRAVLPTP